MNRECSVHIDQGGCWNDDSKAEYVIIYEKRYMFIKLLIDRVTASHHQRPVLCIQIPSSPAHYCKNNMSIMFPCLRTHAHTHRGIRTGTSERNQKEVCIRIRRFQRSNPPKSQLFPSRPFKSQALHQSRHSVRTLSAPKGKRPSQYLSLC